MHAVDAFLEAAMAGDPPGDPLLWLCYSPFHGRRDDGLEGAARALLDAGADPNTRDGGPYGIPALYAVTGHRHAPRIARLLFEHGADVHARRGDRRSAWLLARRGGFDDVAKLLEEAGAEPEPSPPPTS